jgi:flavorubredoxin
MIIMPVIVVLYDTLSGATDLLVKAVIEGLGDLGEIDLRLLKVGSKFSVSSLNNIDALVIGSPSIYGDMTPPLRALLTNLCELSEQHTLHLTGTKGAVFGSYAWDGGWHVERIETLLVSLGVEMIAPPLAIVDHGGSMRIHPHDLQRCRALGKTLRVNLKPR